jgi:hypothetical protein
MNSLQRFFSSSICCLFTLLIVSFAMQKFDSIYFANYWYYFPSLSFIQKVIAYSYILKFFICSPLVASEYQILISLIHFEFLFIQGEWRELSFSLLHENILFIQHHLSKRLHFLQCMFLSLLLKIRWL